MRVEWKGLWRRRQASPPKIRVLVLATLASGLVTSVATGAETTAAAFTDPTSNVSDSFQSGLVTLADDDTNSAAFSTGTPRNDGNLTSGQTLTRCIKVTYTGSWYGPSLTDSFATADAAKWTYGASRVVNAGALEITPTSGYPALNSVASYDLSDSAAQVKILQVPNAGNGTTETFLTLWGPANYTLDLMKSSTSLVARQKINGSATNVSVAWNAAAMAYWRIKNVGETIYWQYSGDGATWTTLRSAPIPFAITSLKVSLSAGFYGSESSPGLARFDDLAFTPNAGIRMYGTANGALAQYLTLTVDRGTGGVFGNCTGFSSEATIYTGTLEDFAATATDYDSGVGAWSPTASPANKTYRFTVTTSTDPAAGLKTASAVFTWETQSG
jgi:hypothetical protein